MIIWSFSLLTNPVTFLVLTNFDQKNPTAWLFFFCRTRGKRSRSATCDCSAQCRVDGNAAPASHSVYSEAESLCLSKTIHPKYLHWGRFLFVLLCCLFYVTRLYFVISVQRFVVIRLHSYSLVTVGCFQVQHHYH